MELEERGLCRKRQQSMDNDNGNTQQSNSTREKGEEDGTNLMRVLKRWLLFKMVT